LRLGEEGGGNRDNINPFLILKVNAMRKNLNTILYIVWGMIQFIVMMLLGINSENTLIIISLVISNIGMMYVIGSLYEEVETLKGE